jgi:hypothetical protein
MKPIKKPKMVRGGRALAAALAGATLFRIDDGAWLSRPFDAQQFMRAYNDDPTSDEALAYGVCADDAKKVLGPTRSGKAVE